MLSTANSTVADCRQKDDRRRGITFLNSAKNIQTSPSRHLLIRNDDVETFTRQKRNGFRSARRLNTCVSGRTEVGFKNPPHVRFVIDYQDLAHLLSVSIIALLVVAVLP